MVDARFTKEMIEILSSMKGKTFVSYECDEGHGFPRAYANFRINLNDYSIDVSNEIQGLPFFDIEEDVAIFSCKKVDSNSKYEPGVIGETRIVPIDETIESVEIITDEINVGNGEYEIVFDAALVIKTEYQTIMFSRDVWFSEVINISDNDDYDSVYPIDSVIEHWNNEGDYEVTVKRTKKSI